MTALICAVDVGTRSARAGLFDPAGQMLAREIAGISVHEGPGRVAEYQSEAIWDAVCAAVRRVCRSVGVEAQQVAALGFDATCSLVLRDRQGAPLALGPDGRDTIAWFDHRAMQEAAECTATGHDLIRHMGGVMSPEMQTPKLMWLKRHRPDLWAELGQAADLADDLVRRATQGQDRSACTLGAKWPYLPGAGGWQSGFLQAVGLADLQGRAGLAGRMLPVGAQAGALCPSEAAALGLPAGIPVAAGLVDAYAGALGTLGGGPRARAGQRLTLTAGTSSCIMAITPEPLFASGIWGPFRDVILPGYWVSEGGQSASGALLDYVIDLWPGDARPGHGEILDRIGQLLDREGPALGREMHVLPDFAGNRSPHADPSALGAISGLALDRSFDGLCRLYWRCAVALALGVRQIVEHMGEAGLEIALLSITGGLTRSPLMLQLYADATGLEIAPSAARDSVLLGTAIAAASAAGLHGDLDTAAQAMGGVGESYHPDPARTVFYDRDYRAFLLMQAQRRELAAL